MLSGIKNGYNANAFDPIGNSGAGNEFIGNFDGKGFTIDNLHINRPGEDQVGLFGFVGSGGTVTNVGVVGGNITGAHDVGGLVGKNRGTIIDSHATGGTVTGTHCVGGLVGYDGGFITDSHATGDVTVNIDDTEEKIGAGGLVGGSDNSTITNSHATGDVTVTVMDVVNTAIGAGGLVGGNLLGTIENSYATGEVTGMGMHVVGGLVGVNGGTITNSYATGTVTVTGMYAAGGGLVGWNDGTITASFWDTTNNPGLAGVGAGDAAGATGKTTAEMKQSSTFTDVGWDYTNIWTQQNGVTYPYFQWQTVTVFATPAAKEGICFVATAAFGTPMAEEVEILSRLRDEYLLTNELGQRFVALYNRHSPALAEFISEREWARRAVRITLWPLVRMAELLVD